MVYDVVAGTELNLGPGSPAVFSPDSKRLAWVAAAARPAAGEVWLMDLQTGERISLGPGRLPQFLDSERLAVYQPSANLFEVINLTNNQRSHPSTPVAGEVVRLLPDGTALVQTLRQQTPNASGYTLRLPDGRRLLEFEALAAAPAGPGELVVATSPQDGTTNIFIVNVASGVAEFVATSRWTPPSWPLGASADFVVWTEGYCGASQGKTRPFERRNRAITEIDASLWVTMTPAGLIGAGGIRTIGANRSADDGVRSGAAVARRHRLPGPERKLVARLPLREPRPDARPRRAVRPVKEACGVAKSHGMSGIISGRTPKWRVAP
jgi:hypothetical protein